MDYESWRIEQQAKTNFMLDAYDTIVIEPTEDILGTETLANEYWGNKHCKGVVLSGPEGCGKHTLAAHIIQLFRRRVADCQFLFLDGAELENDGVKATTLCDFLGRFLDDCYDGFYYDFNDNDELKRTKSNIAPLDSVVLIEEPEHYSAWKKILPFLQKNVLQYSLEPDLPRLFVLILSADSVKLPSLLNGRLRSLFVSRPEKKLRIRFAQNRGGELLNSLSATRVAELTEGMTYTQLQDALDATNYLVASGSFNKEMLEDFLGSQRPLLTPQERHMRFEEQLPRALEKLSGTGIAMSVQGGAAHNDGGEQMDVNKVIHRSKDEDTASAQDKMRKELETKSGAELSEIVLGKDRTKRLMEAAKKRLNS
ncbi:MAG: ATP-binding protein [Oscillospiraceae bacterium]|nr:ATP-binding protein [Oscillospiraceae bacterium]